MAEYDPQRSRPRRRVTDDAGPAPVDEMLDATPEPPAAPRATPERTNPSSSEPRPGSSANGGRAATSPPEIVDLAPMQPTPPERSPRRARLLLVLAVVGLALVGFVLRRIGAARRARRL